MALSLHVGVEAIRDHWEGGGWGGIKYSHNSFARGDLCAWEREEERKRFDTTAGERERRERETEREEGKEREGVERNRV